MIYVKPIGDRLIQIDLDDYHQATAAELQKIEQDKQLAEKKRALIAAKRELAETDYKTLKFVDGKLSEEDYAPIRAQRQALRDRINALEIEIGGAL